MNGVETIRHTAMTLCPYRLPLLLPLLAVFAGCDAGGGAADLLPAGFVAVETLEVRTVDGRTVSGLLGFVTGSRPKRLVVFCHGLGHTVEGSWFGHVRRTVRPDTAVVATNYRDNLAFPVLKGAQDTNTATQLAITRFPSVETVYLLGVSMGGAVSGTALTESMQLTADGSSLYDYWIDIEGVSNLTEIWLGATLVLPEVARQIEDDAGGTPFEVPPEYVRRSPVLRTREMKAGALRAAVVVHAPNDGLVPYEQGRQMALALVAAGIPTQVFNVLRDGDGQSSGTTATGVIAGFFGAEDPNETLGLDLAGHGSERDIGHPVIRAGFEQLARMLDDAYDAATPYAETLVDDGA